MRNDGTSEHAVTQVILVVQDEAVTGVSFRAENGAVVHHARITGIGSAEQSEVVAADGLESRNAFVRGHVMLGTEVLRLCAWGRQTRKTDNTAVRKSLQEMMNDSSYFAADLT